MSRRHSSAGLMFVVVLLVVKVLGLAARLSELPERDLGHGGLAPNVVWCPPLSAQNKWLETTLVHQRDFFGVAESGRLARSASIAAAGDTPARTSTRVCCADAPAGPEPSAGAAGCSAGPHPPGPPQWAWRTRRRTPAEWLPRATAAPARNTASSGRRSDERGVCVAAMGGMGSDGAAAVVVVVRGVDASQGHSTQRRTHLKHHFGIRPELGLLFGLEPDRLDVLVPCSRPLVGAAKTAVPGQRW
jgi:hypothetical protein